MLIIFGIDILAIHKQFCNAETSVVFGLEVIKIHLGVLRERVFVGTCLIERISVVVPIQVRTHIVLPLSPVGAGRVDNPFLASSASVNH